MTRFLLVCLGGAAGSGARYLVSLWMLERFGRGFPWGTLAVNVVGSFAMGVVMSRALPEAVRVPLTTGVLGGFTTYSAFNHELSTAFDGGEWARGGVYLVATVVGALAAGFLGAALGRAVPPG